MKTSPNNSPPPPSNPSKRERNWIASNPAKRPFSHRVQVGICFIQCAWRYLLLTALTQGHSRLQYMATFYTYSLFFPRKCVVMEIISQHSSVPSLACTAHGHSAPRWPHRGRSRVFLGVFRWRLDLAAILAVHGSPFSSTHAQSLVSDFPTGFSKLCPSFSQVLLPVSCQVSSCVSSLWLIFASFYVACNVSYSWQVMPRHSAFNPFRTKKTNKHTATEKNLKRKK